MQFYQKGYLAFNVSKGFTLIELIIVVVIISILAMVAIPRYFVNIKKARKAQVVSNMKAIRDAMMSYNAINNSLPTVSGTIIVNVDGDQFLTLTVPANYTFADPSIFAPAVDGCSYTMNLGTGAVVGTGGCP